MMLQSVLLFLFVAFAAAQWQPLPRNINVTHYELDINIDMPPIGESVLDKPDVWRKASVQIFFDVVVPTDQIELNSDGLRYIQGYLFSENTTQQRWNVKYSIDETEQLLIVKTPIWLNIGKRYSLILYYEIKTLTEERGLYYSTWNDEKGRVRNVAGTQFEEIDARKMVPCLDDPSFRATWQVNVLTSPGYSVVSNTERISLIKNETQWEHVFAKTPSIPSYLLAIVVHDYDQVSRKTPNGFNYSYIAPRTTLDICEAMIDFTGKAIDHLMEKFSVVKYPYSKIDFVPIPQFAAGAMENPGLITFNNDVYCTGDPFNLLVVIHELVHQWFGDAVTPISWSNLAMSEGFATYYQRPVYRELTGAPYPDIFPLEYPGTLMSQNFKPIIVKPTGSGSVDDFAGYQDYYKSAFLFGMLKKLIGAKAFNSTIQTYLKTNENGWGSLDKLLTTAEKYATILDYGDQLKQIMTPYFTRTEYPVIFVEKVDKSSFKLIPVLAKDDNDTVFDNPPSGAVEEYYVPVWYITPNNKDKKLIIAQIGKPIVIKLEDEAIILNPDAISYHRTCFVQPEQWLPAAIATKNNDFWRQNTLGDFKVCTKHQFSPVFKKVLQILEWGNRKFSMAVQPKWIKI